MWRIFSQIVTRTKSPPLCPPMMSTF